MRIIHSSVAQSLKVYYCLVLVLSHVHFDRRHCGEKIHANLMSIILQRCCVVYCMCIFNCTFLRRSKFFQIFFAIYLPVTEEFSSTFLSIVILRITFETATLIRYNLLKDIF